MWCKPANLTQIGPARMFSFSQDSLVRNFTLGQQDNDLRFRVRRDGSGSNGTPELNAANVMTMKEAQYVGVFTATGAARLYKDGVQVASTSWNPINNTWNSSFRLLLANEEAGIRPWLGEIYMVALYNKALSDAEILTNYAEGSNPDLWAPISSIDVSGPASLCQEEQGLFEVLNPTVGLTYTWNFGPGATPPTAVGVGPHNVSWTSQGLKNFTVLITGGACGDDTATSWVDINCDPLGLCDGLGCAVPPHLDRSVLWGIESDAGFLFSMSDYLNPFGTFTNQGQFYWDDNGSLGALGQHIEAFDIGPDGTIYTKNLRTARCIDTYICRGGDVEIWEPRFTFHGFQYVEITGCSSEPPMETITGIVVHSDTPKVGSFECSDARLNKLYRNIIQTQRANFIDIPTDCPQRDERLGWTGDAQAYVRTACLNMDVQSFFHKWIVDLTDAQLPDGDRHPDLRPAVAVAGSTYPLRSPGALSLGHRRSDPHHQSGRDTSRQCRSPWQPGAGHGRGPSAGLPRRCVCGSGCRP